MSIRTMIDLSSDRKRNGYEDGNKKKKNKRFPVTTIKIHTQSMINNEICMYPKE